MPKKKVVAKAEARKRNSHGGKRQGAGRKAGGSESCIHSVSVALTKFEKEVLDREAHIRCCRRSDLILWLMTDSTDSWQGLLIRYFDQMIEKGDDISSNRRRRLDERVIRSYPVSVVLTETQKQVLDRLAQNNGWSRSKVIRSLMADRNNLWVNLLAYWEIRRARKI